MTRRPKKATDPLKLETATAGGLGDPIKLCRFLSSFLPSVSVYTYTVYLNIYKYSHIYIYLYVQTYISAI